MFLITVSGLIFMIITSMILWCLAAISTPYDDAVDDEEQIKFLIEWRRKSL